MASNAVLPHPLVRPPLTIGGLISLSFKRLIFRPGLTLLAILGITLAVGLVSSATLFSQAVDQVVLNQELAQLAKTTGRPPFSTRIYILPSSEFPVSLTDAEDLSGHVAGSLASEVGLPVMSTGLEVESGGMMLYTKPEPGGFTSNVESVNLVHIADVQNHIQISGEPLDAPQTPGVVDVWIHTTLAERMGTNVGNEYQIGRTTISPPITVRVRGVWQAKDATDDFWYSNPDMTLKDALLVRRQDYIDSVQPMLESRSRFVAWHIMLDDSKVLPSRARQYVRGFARALVVIGQYLPGVKLDIAPIRPLEEFVDRNRALTTLLLGFNIPAFGFLLYFLVLTSAIIARWQRRETAILVSRGMSLWAVLSVTVVEESLLFFVGVPLGIGLGVGIAQLMWRADSFLSFIPRDALPISLNGVSIPFVLITLAVAMMARLWPAMTAARISTVDQEREQARFIRAPFWQRYFLDFLLVIPTYYAYSQLANRGTLAMLVNDRPTDLYRDPLLILVPALFVLTGSLLIMRLFPLLIRLMDWMASAVPWVTPYIALRQLGRQSQTYINPLLLVIVSLALGVYTFSMAGSLDQWLVDRMYYQVGTDLSFKPVPASAATSSSSMSSGGSGDTGLGDQWVLPLEDFVGLPGVDAGTRVGDYSATAKFNGQQEIRGRFLGVDRLTFPKVTWWRDDFADETLGDLMNRLASQPDGVLVPQEALDQMHIQIGEQFTIHINMGDDLSVDSLFTVVGTYKYFPTVYADRVAVIGNLDYLFSYFGTPLAHNIWLRLQPGVDGKDVVASMLDIGIVPSQSGDAQASISAEKAKTERVGVFGTLSVGFLAAAAMAIAGLLINTYASLNERLTRFAVLHAIGLQRRQILGQLIMEYFFLTTYGAAAGALIGSLAGELFTPFFRVTGTQEIPLPPLLPVIARDQIINLAALFAIILIVLELTAIASALYRRLFRMLTLRSQA